MAREYRKIEVKQHDPEISMVLDDGSRKILFEKDCLDKVDIFRREQDGSWSVLAKDIFSPYYDDVQLESTCLEYKIRISGNGGMAVKEAVFQVRV